MTEVMEWLDNIPDWQYNVTFSDRLSVISKIAKELYNSGSSSDHTQAQNDAKIFEKEHFNGALSWNAYDNAWRQKLISLNCLPRREEKISKPDQMDLDAGEMDLDEGASHLYKFGEYGNATLHWDGKYACIWKAPNATGRGYRDESNLKMVALKITTPSRLDLPHDSKREARILRVATSSNTIPLLETFYDREQYVMVLPFMPYDLETVLQTCYVDHLRARSHLRDVFRGLAHIHAKGIIHRDLKPANILLRSAAGPAYLADFGISWMRHDETSEKADEMITDVGTGVYRPPETLLGNTSYNEKLDMWAAGCVAAEVVCLSTKTLFNAGTYGNELSLLHSIFTTLGTPTLETWPEAAQFRDWGKFTYYEYPAKDWNDLLPNASEEGRDLVSKLVRYQSKWRWSAADALRHHYFMPRRE